MKVIAQRVWHEPAACIGLLVSLALLALALLSGAEWDASVIAGIVAPLISALGIRQLVTPVTPEPAPPTDPAAGTTLHRPDA